MVLADGVSLFGGFTIAEDLGISATSIASAYAFATLIAALGLTRMGVFIDRYGARRVMIAVVILLGFACAAFGAAAGVITLSLVFMCLRFLGQGSMMMGYEAARMDPNRPPTKAAYLQPFKSPLSDIMTISSFPPLVSV